jgi:signal transduction histidine kinase/ActR/RegA family two-component response regulator
VFHSPAETYHEYHRRRLAGRTIPVGIAGAVGYVLFVLAGGGGHWGLPTHLVSIGLFTTAGRMVGHPRWAVPSVFALHTLTILALLFFDHGFGTSHPEWIVLSILGYSALAPLPSPTRELQSLLWVVAISVNLAVFGSASGALGNASMLAALLVGWSISWANGESWRKSWDDGELQRQLTDRLAGARDTLEQAVDATRQELAAQQERLVQQERLATLGRLAAGIAHEINNPLAVALTNIELASADNDPDPLLLEDARASLRRIRNIVADLSRVARPGDFEQVEAVPLDQVLAYAADVVRVIVKGGMKIRIMTVPGTIVKGNRGRLEQVMVNLLVNAWQAAAPRGRGSVNISSAEKSEVVQLFVDDDGPGIPDDIIDEIFEPFFTTKPAGEGSGLGLAISRSYMRAMGGDLVAGKSPLGGARFSVTLPRLDHVPIPVSPPIVDVPPAEPEPAAGQSTDPSGLPALLVVDDEPALRRSLSRGLRREWRVFTAANRAEALSIMGAETIDALLCDLVLPEEAGVEVIRAIARTHPRILSHTVLMTGEPAGSELQAIARLNAQHLVRKPFDLEDLACRLQDARKGHRSPLVLDATPEAAQIRRYTPA